MKKKLDAPPLTLILPPEEQRLTPEQLKEHLRDLVRVLARQAADEDFEREQQLHRAARQGLTSV